MAFKKVIDFYLNSSPHVALSVLSLAVISMFHFNFPLDVDLLGFIFLGTITGYNFIKYAGVAKLHHRSLTRNLKLIQIFSFFCFIGLIYYVLQVPLEVLFITSLFGCLTLFYGLPFLSKTNLRSVRGVKIYIIALVWAGVTVILPVVNSGSLMNLDVVMEFSQRFILVLVLILPFEIRDLPYDSNQLGTIPQMIGVERTRFFGVVLLVIWLLIEFLQGEPQSEIILSMFIVAILLAILLLRAKERQSAYYAAFFVEAIPILWLLVILLLKDLF